MQCSLCGGRTVGHGRRTTASGETYQRYKCRDCSKYSQAPVDEVIVENVRLAKQKQALQDKNRIANKSFREFARVENAVEEYSKNLVAIFKKNKLHKATKSNTLNPSAVGVIQLSDVHFNELIDLQDNRYDFKVASRRIKHLINQASNYFKAYKITNVLLALTGDLMNSDRRLDELLNQATNRSQATFLAVDILQQALQQLNEDFKVSVACVSGNEGRVNKEFGWSPVIATDNYDFTIFNILQYVCKDSEIEFIEGDPSELVINVAGQNLLLMHGNCSLRHAALDKSINQVLGRYSMKGVKLDYIIMGHVHSASVGDNYARSASVAGANDYSDKGLNLTSRASQNCYIFYENGNRDGIKVDLQNVPKKGYDIDDSLVAYNAKSINKGRNKHRIMEIVI